MVTEKKVMVGLTPDKGVTKLLNGPPLRHVGALPTSSEIYNADGSSKKIGNYNFEEEYLLGDNKVTLKQYEDGYYRERIEFRRENQSTDYYFIEYYEKDTSPDEYDMTLEGRKLVINLHNKIDNLQSSYSLDSKSMLYYKQKDGSDVFISEKKINRKVTNQNGYIQESITRN